MGKVSLPELSYIDERFLVRDELVISEETVSVKVMKEKRLVKPRSLDLHLIDLIDQD